MRWNADDYSRNSSAQTSWARDLLRELRLEGWERVLDIGCGDGRITSELREATPLGGVVGIDLSPEMVDLARRTYGERPGLEFEVMDATRLGLPGVFDVAFSNATLHWVADHRAVLRSLRRLLSDRGRILFQMGGRGNADGVAKAVNEICDTPPYRDRFHGFVSPYNFLGVEEYRAWLPLCGYREVRVVLLPRDMEHVGAEGLRGWLRTTWFPYTDRLEPDMRERFWDVVLERYLGEHPVDAAGHTHVAMARLEVEAVVEPRDQPVDHVRRPG